MRRRPCPKCRTRLPYAAQRCSQCGWLRHTGARGTRRGLATGLGVALLSLALIAFAAVHYSDRYLPALADWYMGFALRFVPASELVEGAAEAWSGVPPSMGQPITFEGDAPL